MFNYSRNQQDNEDIYWYLKAGCSIFWSVRNDLSGSSSPEFEIGNIKLKLKFDQRCIYVKLTWNITTKVGVQNKSYRRRLHGDHVWFVYQQNGWLWPPGAPSKTHHPHRHINQYHFTSPPHHSERTSVMRWWPATMFFSLDQFQPVTVFIFCPNIYLVFSLEHCTRPGTRLSGENLSDNSSQKNYRICFLQNQAFLGTSWKSFFRNVIKLIVSIKHHFMDTIMTMGTLGGL